MFFFLLEFNLSSREIHDGFRKVGFRTNTGLLGTGLFILVWTRLSGYYIGMRISPPRTELSQLCLSI